MIIKYKVELELEVEFDSMSEDSNWSYRGKESDNEAKADLTMMLEDNFENVNIVKFEKVPD